MTLETRSGRIQSCSTFSPQHFTFSAFTFRKTPT
jgi:hypothetical protein